MNQERVSQKMAEIIDKLANDDKQKVLKALLTAPSLKTEREISLLMDTLTEVQQKALSQIIFLKLEDELAQEKLKESKQSGSEIRQTAIAILQSLIASSNTDQALNDNNLCDRALKMAQRLHDAT